MHTSSVQKSTFVNVLAWFFIVCAGFASLISILQNIIIYTIFPREEMNQAIQHSNNLSEFPFFIEFLFNHINLFFSLFMVICIVTFVSSIALLKRKNWARLTFIWLMSIGILWNVFGIVMQFSMFQSIPVTHQAPHDFQMAMHIMQIASFVMASIFCLLFGFIIKKLTSQKFEMSLSNE